VIAEGDMVAVRVIEVSTHEGEYDRIPPTGKKIYVENHFFMRMAEGKIAEVWLLESTLWKMMQLGMELKPKEEK
ncbi:MAG: ester cyclase, partial [Candidatus Hodarchaeota archaeon]